MKMLDAFRAARQVSTPLISISTPDPAATMLALQATFKEPAKVPMLRWSCATGLTGYNQAGNEAAAAVLDGGDPLMMTGNPTEALMLARRLPPDSLLFFLQAHRYLDNESVAMACWELRDAYKASGSTIVFLSPGFVPPVELASDVLSLDEPLPTEAELAQIIARIHQDAQMGEPAPETVTAATAALSGLAAFPAEQALAMSLEGSNGSRSLNIRELWERKRRMISDTPGLSVFRGPERFDGLGGLANAKRFLSGVLTGRRPPRAIVFIDEIEKALAGSAGDTTGVTQDQLGTLLSYMEDNRAAGILLLGPPGAGKSAIAKAAGNEGAIPTIQLDLGGTKASLVGQTEQRTRAALKVITAVSSGFPLFVATCNSVAALPPELLRRFSLAKFFVDLPTSDERAAIWPIYLAQYELPDQPTPPDEGWTGAEIRNACDIANRLNVPLAEAASYIVPVAKSSAAAIERLRNESSSRYISASEPGTYEYRKIEVSAPAPARRRFQG